MLAFLTQRLLQIIPTLILVSMLIFGLQQLLPGDPALIMAGEERDPKVLEEIRQQYRLNEPIPIQYFYWMKGVLSGNLGESMRLKSSVASLVAEKLPVTLQLAGMAILVALGIGIPAGIVSAVKKDTAWDYGANLFALWGISTPNFWLGILMIFLFSVTLGWLPASGYVRLGEDWRASLATTIMPAFVLGNAIAAVLMRHTRSAMLQAMGADYVRTARAKGLYERPRGAEARAAQRHDAGDHPARARLRHPAVGRGADRADLHHPGLRQADRRCRLQPRLCRGPGRRAGDGHDLHLAQPAGRRRLRAGQSEAARMTAATLPTVVVADATEENPWARAWRRLKRRKGAMVGLVVVVLFVLLAVFAPLIAPYDPIATSCSQVRKPPSWAHWLGTDEVGRDVLSRVIWGARASLSAGLVSVGIALGVGVPLGLLAGYAGGWIDAVLSRIVDAMLAVPFLILAIALAAFLGPSLSNAMIAIGVTATPVFVRLTRGQTLAAKVEDYVEAARAVGNPHWRIALRHVLPNIVPPLLVQASLAIAGAIIAEAALSFLGLGQQPPSPSWGSMLNSAQRFIAQAPWMAFWPGFAIFFAVLSFNLLGDGLRDALDPRHK